MLDFLSVGYTLPIVIGAMLCIVTWFIGRQVLKIFAWCFTSLSVAISAYELMSSEIFTFVLSLLSLSEQTSIVYLFFSSMGIKFTYLVVIALFMTFMIWGIARKQGV